MQQTVDSIWNEFSSKLGQFIHARVADTGTAEDILQNVFVKFQSRLDEFRDPQKLRGWLFLVARNAIIDHYRTRKVTSELSESLPDESSEGRIEMDELKLIFRQIIDGLPDPYREAIELTEFEGLKQDEVAKRLGISLSGAKSRVQRGRELLKNLLLDLCHREFARMVGSQPCPKGLVPTVTAAKPALKHKPVRRSNKSKHGKTSGSL